MSFEYLTDPGQGPGWQGVLPGQPEAFFLQGGEGEHAMLFTDLFTVLLSGDETGGQFGLFTMQAPAGQLIPAHNHHGTHEVFYVVDGSLRVYVAGRDGTKRAQRLGPHGAVWRPGPSHSRRFPPESPHSAAPLSARYTRSPPMRGLSRPTPCAARAGSPAD